MPGEVGGGRPEKVEAAASNASGSPSESKSVEDKNEAQLDRTFSRGSIFPVCV